MITMEQRAQLHRIFDNCILLSNSGTEVNLNFDNKRIRVEFRTGDKPCYFTTLGFDSPMSFSDLVTLAETTEHEMGVEN